MAWFIWSIERIRIRPYSLSLDVYRTVFARLIGRWNCVSHENLSKSAATIGYSVYCPVSEQYLTTMCFFQTESTVLKILLLYLSIDPKMLSYS